MGSSTPHEAKARSRAPAGGSVVRAQPDRVLSELRTRFPGATAIASAAKDIVGNFALQGCTDPRDLAAVDIAVVRASLGVAETGAVWLCDADLPHRVLPFLCQHLAVVLDAKAIVATMHEAYRRVEMSGFGSFVAGPSKTADIEQCLVVGAQGARSFTVFVA